MSNYDREKLFEEIDTFKNGNEAAMKKFVDKTRDYAVALYEQAKATKPGGVTKITAHWWGVRFYISH